jgi:VIT family
MPRVSHHIEPQGTLQIARHYVRELIYGANDGIITTFAVVAGVAGGGLSLRVVPIIGAANLFANGLLIGRAATGRAARRTRPPDNRQRRMGSSISRDQAHHRRIDLTDAVCL